jgi:hypothetical protein
MLGLWDLLSQGGGCSYNNNLIGYDELHITAGNTVKAPTDATLRKYHQSDSYPQAYHRTYN